MQKVTTVDLEFAVTRYVRILASEGMGREVRLVPGSKADGNAYRLYFTDHRGAQWGAYGTSNGYLGMTKREAYDTLHTICQAMEDLQHIQELSNTL